MENDFIENNSKAEVIYICFNVNAHCMFNGTNSESKCSLYSQPYKSTDA